MARAFYLGVMMSMAISVAAAWSPAPAEPYPMGIRCTGDGTSNAEEPEQAAARGDFAAAIEAARRSVAEMCDNPYRWLVLAKYYQLGGKSAEALEVAAYVYGQGKNQLATWLEQDVEGFGALKTMPGFEGSAWGKAWAADQAERDARVARGRAALAALPPAQRPAERFVTGEACPFECCEFREWTVEQAVELYDAADGKKIGRSVNKGETVLGLTGNVHLRPRPILVQRPIEVYLDDGTATIPAGEIVFELQHLGEGFSALWHRGKIYDGDAGWLLPEGCLAIDAECWGDHLSPPREEPADYQWWVKVRLADGKEAWARSDGFGNMDGCG